MSQDNNDLHAVGTILGVENKAGGNGKTFYVVKFKLLDGTELDASTYDSKIWQVFQAQQQIQFGYREVQKGQWTNRYMGQWSVVDGGGVPATTSAVPTGHTPATTTTQSSTSVVPQSPDARSDNIVRQSSLHQATALVCAMMRSDNLPFPKSGKGKKVASDPQAILALVFDIAGQIKEQVFNGDWEQPTDEPPELVDGDTGTEYTTSDIPF